MNKLNQRWKYSIFLLIAVLLTLNVDAAHAQHIVKGTVTDSNNEALIGVSVVEKGTTNGNVTDIDGVYTLTVSDPNATIVFSYVGFNAQEIALKGRKTLNVELTADDAILDEVVVVGYGVQKKVNLTGAVAQVDGIELQKMPTGNLSATLQGKLPGLVTKQSSGQPGSDGASLYVRGVGAGDGNLLVVVDGVVRAFPSIDPEEIESISILKDATAAAVYGVRASAGVMIITTKRGKVQKPTVNFNSSVSVNTNTTFPKFLKGADYATWYNKAQELDGISEENRRFTAGEIDRLRNGDPQGVYYPTDWVDALFEDYGLTTNNVISVSGGTETVKYFASLGAQNQKGIIDNTGFDRYNFRSNLDINITKDLSLSFGVGARHSKTTEPGLTAGSGNSYASIFSQAFMAYPIISPYGESGLYTGTANGAGNGNQNPLAARDLSGKRTIHNKKIESNVKLEYKFPFLKGLKASLNAAYDNVYQINKHVFLPYQLSVYNQNTRMWSVEYGRHLPSAKARVQQAFYEQYDYTIQPALEYSNKFGKHAVSGLFLYEYTQTKYNSMSAARESYPIEDIMDLQFGEEVMDDLVTGGHNLNKRAGYVGRLNYAYDEKYLAEVTLRYDGTPYLPKDTRWGLFPGVSVGWRISEEPFFKDNIPNVENLKIRGSVGRLGSEAGLGHQYSYFSTVSMGQTPVVMIGDELERYLGISAPPNRGLKWQVNDTYNIGVETSMWKGLLGVELDVFYMLTSRTLESQSTYPPSAGVYYPRMINYGKHENRGFELVLSHRNQIGDFNYSVRGNVSWARNKVLKIAEDANLPSSKRALGRPKGQYFGFLSDGLFQSEEEIASSALYGPTKVGDIKLVDVNGDGRITMDQDMVPIGRSNIPEMMYGLSIDASYKQFDFNVFFQGAAMFDMYLAGMYSDRGFVDDTFYTRPFYVDGNSPYFLIEGSWTPENTNAKYPRLGVEARSNGGKYSDWWLVDGTYLRLKSAQIGYTIPKNITRKANIEKVRLTVTGNNLFTLTEFKYLDPEMPGVNQGYYPQQRQFEFGINVTF